MTCFPTEILKSEFSGPGAVFVWLRVFHLKILGLAAVPCIRTEVIRIFRAERTYRFVLFYCYIGGCLSLYLGTQFCD